MSQLADILIEYKSISEAPTIAELVYWADKNGVNVDTALNAERRKKYKAIDGQGMVWLIRNPSVWEYKDGSYIRPAPELQGHISSFRKVKKTAPKTNNENGDWF
jgi:hypothetical protein